MATTRTYTNTNVVRFHQAYHAHSSTDDFYLKGVGTRFDAGRQGLRRRLRHSASCRASTRPTITCARPGPPAIASSTSSGSAAARRRRSTSATASRKRGIRRPGSDEVVEPKPTIRFLGVWDVVAAFGLANLGNTALNIGHHLSLPKSNLRYCFHAMALDERRPSFLQTRLNGACEVWFRGVHSDVGGGNTNRGLNDIALKWMMSKAKAAGLPIADEDFAALKPTRRRRRISIHSFR